MLPDQARCGHYADRQRLVPDCIKLNPDNISELRFMPSTCAYRLVAEGRDLPSWHPLVTGKRDSVHRALMSVRYRCVSEHEVLEDDLPERIVEWPR